MWLVLSLILICMMSSVSDVSFTLEQNIRCFDAMAAVKHPHSEEFHLAEAGGVVCAVDLVWYGFWRQIRLLIGQIQLWRTASGSLVAVSGHVA